MNAITSSSSTAVPTAAPKKPAIKTTTTESPPYLLIGLTIGLSIIIICILIILIVCLLKKFKKKPEKNSTSKKTKKSKIPEVDSKTKSMITKNLPQKTTSSEPSKSKSLTTTTQHQQHQQQQLQTEENETKEIPSKTKQTIDNILPLNIPKAAPEIAPHLVEKELDMKQIRTIAEYFLDIEQQKLRIKNNDEKFVISNDECPDYIKDMTQMYPENPKISSNFDEVQIFLARIDTCIEKSEVLRENVFTQFSSRKCSIFNNTLIISYEARKWYKDFKTAGYYQCWAFIHEFSNLFSWTPNSAEMNEMFDSMPISLLYCYFINEKIPLWIRLFAMEKIRKAVTPFLKKSDPAMLSILPHPIPIISIAYQQNSNLLEDPYWQSLDGNVRSFLETKKDQRL